MSFRKVYDIEGGVRDIMHPLLNDSTVEGGHSDFLRYCLICMESYCMEGDDKGASQKQYIQRYRTGE